MAYPWQARRRRQCVFRGIPFEALEHERSVGQRVHVHTYPGFDEPFVETLGREPRPYAFQAIFAGPDFDLDVERFERAIEQPGRGRLEGWTGAPVFVVGTKCQVVERSDEQGFALVALEFIEAGSVSASATRRAGRSLIDRALAAVRDAAVSAFPGVAANVASVSALGAQMAVDLEVLHGELVAALDTIDRNVGAASDAASALVVFADELDSLATDAAAAGSRVSALVDSLSASPGDVGRKFDTMLGLLGFGDRLPGPAAPAGYQAAAAANQTALADLLAELAAAQLAALTARLPFESAQDAARHRGALADALDSVLFRAADAGAAVVYRELRTAKALAVAELDDRAARLPELVTVTLPAEVPSIVLAWRLYGDPSRGPELAERNEVRHPAFMPAGQVLEVLSEAPSDG